MSLLSAGQEKSLTGIMREKAKGFVTEMGDPHTRNGIHAVTLQTC
jgi:hypothetical protein